MAADRNDLPYYDIGAITVANILSTLGQGCESNGAPPQITASPKDTALALNLILVALEAKPATGEVKIQAGQGILVAGTWSPKNGFGFQLGAGFDAEVGVVKATAVGWLKTGSDGSRTPEAEAGVGVGKVLGGSWSGTVSHQVSPATHEPIGAL